MRILMEVEFDDDHPIGIILDRLDLSPPYVAWANDDRNAEKAGHTVPDATVAKHVMTFVAKNILAMIEKGEDVRVMDFVKTKGRPPKQRIKPEDIVQRETVEKPRVA